MYTKMLYQEKKDCCGCSACYNICPKRAIKMVPDELGFLYPMVDEDKCIDCKLCRRVCSFNKDYDKTLNLDEPKFYGVRHHDLKEVSTSRSGAAFIAITDYVLENNGIVYGVGYEDGFRVVHKRAADKNTRDQFKGSKYVQSDVSNIFSLVKEDLLAGKTVLFSGTPCQTAGLISFVGEKLRDNLYLIDIICHGVPSPYIYRDYLNYIKKQEGQEIIAVNFRDKDLFGWKDAVESVTFGTNKQYYKIYSRLFFKNIMLRESCGNCYFTNLIRPSDITIGDFWGWQKVDKEINSDDKGISLLLCNTDKGHRLFTAVKNSMYVIPTQKEVALQPNLSKPTKLNKNRDNFRNDYVEHGFEYILKKYVKIKLETRMKLYLVNLWLRIK